jgi:hypothetical protein
VISRCGIGQFGRHRSIGAIRPSGAVSIQSGAISINLDEFNPIWAISINLDRIQSIWAISINLDRFQSIWSDFNRSGAVSSIWSGIEST